MNLKQLSHMLSLSQTTVSRALNGYPEVNEETRRRVVDAAKRHGYRPNPSARRLATGKAGMIGYVMPTGDSVDIDPHFVEFLSGLGDYARAHELDLVLSPTAADEEETTYRRIVANKQVDAIYVSSPRPADRRIALLNQLGIPYIVHGRTEGLDFDYPYLDIDNEAAFHDAARLLVQLGHRRDRADQRRRSRKTFAIHRERGVRRALAASGLTLRAEQYVVSVGHDRGERLSRRARACSSRRARRPRSSAPVDDHGARHRAGDRASSASTFPRDLSLIAHDAQRHDHRRSRRSRSALATLEQARARRDSRSPRSWPSEHDIAGGSVSPLAASARRTPRSRWMAKVLRDLAVDQRDAPMAELHQQTRGVVEGRLVVDVEIGIVEVQPLGAAMHDDRGCRAG